jgi:hypothetical protein
MGGERGWEGQQVYIYATDQLILDFCSFGDAQDRFWILDCEKRRKTYYSRKGAKVAKFRKAKTKRGLGGAFASSASWREINPDSDKKTLSQWRKACSEPFGYAQDKLHRRGVPKKRPVTAALGRFLARFGNSHGSGLSLIGS